MTLINYNQVLANTTVTTTTETVAAILQPIGAAEVVTPEGLVIRGIVNMTPGTAATAVTMRVRQGTTTAGTLVGVADVTTVIAAAPITVPYAAQYSGAQVAGNQFCVTVQMTAATASTTLNDASIELLVPSPGGTNN